LHHCEKLLREGADILDIGGESSRPGALPVPLEEESARVLPVVREAVRLGVPISVDTCKPELMQAVLDLGADIINDIWALRQPGAAGSPTALDVVVAHGHCGVCLMHMHGEPTGMQLAPMPGDVLAPVARFLAERTAALTAQGVAPARMTIDPGIGFGKTVAQNFSLLARQGELLALGRPLVVGWSRKSSLAAVSGKSLSSVATLDVRERMVPSVTAAVLAVARGASVVRVHDVRETVSGLSVLAALK
jgi:dihydropteroate synthase